LSDILVESSLRNPVGEKNIAPELFTCFCWERNPVCLGLLVFLSVLPSQAYDRGLWPHCNVWALSGESFPSAQLGTSHLLKEVLVPFLCPKA
jgi:hypothetical protein